MFHYWIAFCSPVYKWLGAKEEYKFTLEEATGRRDVV